MEVLNVRPVGMSLLLSSSPPQRETEPSACVTLSDNRYGSVGKSLHSSYASTLGGTFLGRMRIATVLMTVAALAFAANASADVLDTQLEQLRPVVTQWWAQQGVTATRCDTVEFSRRDYGTNDGTWATTLEGTDLAHPQWPDQHIAVCHVVFAEKLTQQTPALVCTVVLHEWGHILGLDHTADPTNIMYGGALIGPPPVCAAWGAPPTKGTGSMVVGRSTARHARWAAFRAQRRLSRDL